MSRIAVVDGLRGYAALAVIYSHTFVTHFTPKGAGMFFIGHVPFLPLTFASNAWTGVSIFFLLSGFVLALPYTEGRRSMASAGDVWAYYKRRALRIYPVYWAVMIPVMLLRRSWGSVWSFLYDAMFVLTGAGALHPTLWKPWYYSIVWTLQVEILFSLLMPLIFLCMRRFGVTWSLILICIASAVCHVIAMQYFEVDQVRYWMHAHLGSLHLFAAGMAVAFFCASQKQLSHRVLIGIVGSAMAYLSLSLKDMTVLGMTPRLAMATTEILFSVAATLLLLVLLFTNNRWVIRLFSNSLMRLIGMMCYSIYLHHYWLLKFFHPTESLPRLGVYILSLAVISFCTYRFIEFPKKAWKELLPSVVTA